MLWVAGAAAAVAGREGGSGGRCTPGASPPPGGRGVVEGVERLKVGMRCLGSLGARGGRGGGGMQCAIIDMLHARQPRAAQHRRAAGCGLPACPLPRALLPAGAACGRRLLEAIEDCGTGSWQAVADSVGHNKNQLHCLLHFLQLSIEEELAAEELLHCSQQQQQQRAAAGSAAAAAAAIGALDSAAAAASALEAAVSLAFEELGNPITGYVSHVAAWQ